MKRQLLSLITLSSLTLGSGLLAGCGSDSDYEFGGAAGVSINANPRAIDTGDRTTIKISLRDVTTAGLQVKVRFKEALSYVAGSGQLVVDEDEREVSPGTITPVDDDVYIVFYLENRLFGDDERGDLSFELQGIESMEDIEVSVDPDPDSTVTFNPEVPDFAAEATVNVEVVR